MSMLRRLFGPPDPKEDALERYRLFHRKDHRKTGAFHADLVMPRYVDRLGASVHVLYRSSKVDPDTLENPKRPISYIHEHDSIGVTTYTPRARRGARPVRVPDFIEDAEWFVLLGQCLGIAYRPGRGGTVVELESRGRPVTELYTTPDGHALLVITGKRTLDYLIWGGGLDVRPEGIVG
jgi:hypothetical protein